MTGVELIALEANRMIVAGIKPEVSFCKRSFLYRILHPEVEKEEDQITALINIGASIALEIDRLQAAQKEE